MLLRSQKIKQHKSVGVLIVCHFLTSQAWRDKWRVSWFNNFISRLSSETKPCPKSWLTISIVWCRLNNKKYKAKKFQSPTSNDVSTKSNRHWQLYSLCNIHFYLLACTFTGEMLHRERTCLKVSRWNLCAFEDPTVRKASFHLNLPHNINSVEWITQHAPN